MQAVTGAFGFSGKYIAQRLLSSGHQVVTLTNSPGSPNLFPERLIVHPLSFDDPQKLVASLEGAEVLYNTYWVRFNYFNRLKFTYRTAVENSFRLFTAAKQAGVRRVVHVSITNASENSPFEYFRGKGLVEQALVDSGLSYSILRPALLFGNEDILINNIAWMLRKFPFFGIFGGGTYRVQPIFVDDLASLAVESGLKDASTLIQAIGPETFTFRNLVETIGNIIGKPRTTISVPPTAGYLVGTLMGKILNDVVITYDEIQGLMADLLYVDAPPAGSTRLTNWLKTHADRVGKQYHSELARRRRPTKVYP